jgi:hypothetical protein
MQGVLSDTSNLLHQELTGGAAAAGASRKRPRLEQLPPAEATFVTVVR